MVVDAREDVEDLMLLARLVEDRSCNRKRADRYGSNAMVFRVRHNSADLMRVVELDSANLVVIVVRGLERINLCEEAHGCMVEEAAYNGRAFDEPEVVGQLFSRCRNPA